MPFDYIDELRRGTMGGRPRGGRPLGTAGTPPITGGGVAAPGTATDTTATNPALAGMAQSPYQRFLGGLGKGMDLGAGRTGAEEQDIFNRMRERIQGMGKIQETQYTRGMGARGFREGESGIVGRGLSDIRTGTQERLSGAARDVAISSQEKAFGERAQQAQLNLQRMLGGGGMALQGEQSAMQNLLSMYGMMSGSEHQRWSPYWGGMSNIAAGG